MKKRYLFLSLFFLLFFLVGPRYFQAKADHFDPLPTEFSYTDERLSEIRSPCLITLERIDKWEDPLQAYFDKHNISYIDQVRFYTYLYLAQRDAAYFSYNVHRCFVGSLDPLIKQIIFSFFPDFSDYPEMTSDAYSEELAKQIWPPYQLRIEKERANPHTFTPCKDEAVPKNIQSVAKWISWIANLPKPPPPSQDLKKQIEIMKTLRCRLGNAQLELVYAWAGERGLKRHWRIIANQYMQQTGVPLGKTLFVRSILMMGLYDSLIATFDAKFTYCIPRPGEIDESIHPIINDPHSPSYPSGHAAQAGTAEVILSYFFPSDCTQWQQIAKDATDSRIWAGVHTPQDATQGEQLGKEVGTSTLNSF